MLNAAHFIGLLLKADKRQCVALLRTITNDQMRAIVEIIYNVMYGYGHITHRDIRYLKNRRTIIRQLVAKSLPAKRRKELLRKYFSVVRILLKVIRNNISVQWQHAN